VVREHRCLARSQLRPLEHPGHHEQRHQRDQRRQAEACLEVQAPVRGEFGAYASNPIVLNGVVYIQDPDSDVYALNQQTGAVMWKHLYKSPTPSGGPNGLALGYGMLFGATEGSAFALDAKTGKQLWKHKLTNNKNEGIDMAPQLYDNKVLISTIPGSARTSTTPGALGIVYSLNADTGKTIWKFNTIKGGYKLFGHPE
jgi:outer membrane protein assembly factor BamB